MKRIVQCTLLAALFASAELHAADHGHPPELHHGPEPAGPRLGWLVVGYLIFRGGESLSKLAGKVVSRPPQPQTQPPDSWGWAGPWISRDRRVQVVIPRDPKEAWTAFINEQAFELVCTTSDAVNGTATGFVVCAAGKHVRDRFSMRPWATDGNKFELIFEKDTARVTILGRPE